MFTSACHVAGLPLQHTPLRLAKGGVHGLLSWLLIVDAIALCSNTEAPGQQVQIDLKWMYIITELKNI